MVLKLVSLPGLVWVTWKLSNSSTFLKNRKRLEIQDGIFIFNLLKKAMFFNCFQKQIFCK